MKPGILYYGVAYYLEYLTEDRLDRDMELMTRAGFNLIRVGESTWSTWEPREGVFDFSLLRRTLEAAGRHGLSVIVGTPTYAIPPWLARLYPDILAETHAGPNRYGSRQNFDITHAGYRFHAERVLRRQMEAVRDFPCVVGFQLDNETKPYDTCSPRAQALFRDWLKERFGSVEELNRAMGLAYWSNSLGSWEDLPDVRGTINGSLGAEFQAFQRHLVTEFLAWQRSIVDEYRRPDQFVTHNFDFEWRGYSFGLQPEVDHFEAARALTVVGCDIYHPSESALTGAEIAFGGAIARALKGNRNYLVLETQAQGNFGWLPWPGQLRLQAFAHIASGACCVEYWHWHSIHNAIESYWKGVLSHDMTPGETYREAAVIGADLKRLSPLLCGLRKTARVAVLVSNRSLTGFQWFPACSPGETPERTYSDYLRWLCDSLYRLNVEYDILPDTCRDFSAFDLLVVPALYAAAEELAEAVRRYVWDGGHAIATFRSFFADPYLKIRPDAQPHALTECFGLRYDRFTKPLSTELSSSAVSLPEPVPVSDWMELLEPFEGTQVLCAYRHPAWNGTAAVTRNRYGRGQAIWLGCYFAPEGLDALLTALLPELGVSLSGPVFPVVHRTGTSTDGQQIDFWFNFSNEEQTVLCPEPAGNTSLTLPPWGIALFADGIPVPLNDPRSGSSQPTRPSGKDSSPV